MPRKPTKTWQQIIKEIVVVICPTKTWQQIIEQIVMLICAGLIVWAMLYSYTRPHTPPRRLTPDQTEALIEYHDDLTNFRGY